MTASCPHGVVYAMKCLVRPESVRDHVDVLLSFKHLPNLTINDMPGMTARHGNFRLPGMFAPFEGRFAEPCESNLQLLKEKKLEVSLPFLQAGLSPSINRSGEHAYTREQHPFTLSGDHYIAADGFHFKNIKTEADHLRNVKLVKEMRGQMNTLVAEQLFSSLRKDLYFLNMLSCAKHIFMLRLLFNFHNSRIVEEQLRATEAKWTSAFGKCTFDFDAFGCLILKDSIAPVTGRVGSPSVLQEEDAAKPKKTSVPTFQASAAPPKTSSGQNPVTGSNQELQGITLRGFFLFTSCLLLGGV